MSAAPASTFAPPERESGVLPAPSRGLFAGRIVLANGFATLTLLEDDPAPQDLDELPPWGACLVGVRGHGRRLPYVPGFGGHGPRVHRCRCTLADELICGRAHPDKRESADAIRRRRQGAFVASNREARDSAWLADLYGTGAERKLDVKPSPYKRPSEAEVAKTGPARRDRDPELTDAEWREALVWMRRQNLRGELEKQREVIAAQAWIELRRPPVRAVLSSFTDEVRRAWARAVRAIRKENEPAWTLPKCERKAPDKDSQ